jgi:WD40 repeat protein
VDGWIRFWDVKTGEQQFSLENGERIYSLAISPAGTFAAAGLNGKIRVWNVETRQQVLDLAQVGDISRLAFNADGTLLASGSDEGTVNIWTVNGDAVEQAGDGLRVNGSPRALAFSSDSNWLAGGGSTSFAYLWDVERMQEMARIPHGSPVTGVSFSPDGRELLTVSRKVVRIWELDSIRLVPKEELIPFACSHLVSNLSRETWSLFFGEDEYHPICPDLLEENLLAD